MRIIVLLLMFVFILMGTLSVLAACETGYACSLKDLNRQKEANKNLKNKNFPYPQTSLSSNLTIWDKSKQNNNETSENIDNLFTYTRLLKDIKVVQIDY